MRVAATVAIALLLAGSRGLAQTDPEGGSIGVEVLRPSFDGPGVSAFLWMPEARLRMGPRRLLILQLPVPMASATGIGMQVSIGNPYVGLRWQNDPRTSVQLGFRLPLAPDPNSLEGELPAEAGVLADFLRFEAYLPKVFSASISALTRTGQQGGLLFDVRVGSTFMASTEGGDPELMLDYGFAAGTGSENFELLAGIDGRLIVTSSGDFGERTVHFVTMRANFRDPGWRVRPGLLFRLPLDEAFEDVNWILGVILEFRLR